MLLVQGLNIKCLAEAVLQGTGKHLPQENSASVVLQRLVRVTSLDLCSAQHRYTASFQTTYLHARSAGN